YLTMLYRRRRAVAETQAVAERTLLAARSAGMKEYLGVAHANLAWCHWQLGRGDDCVREGKAALAHWCELRLTFPFEWMARFPLADAALVAGSFETVREHARALLDRAQQRLPDALERALSASIAPDASPDVLRHALGLAVRLGFA